MPHNPVWALTVNGKKDLAATFVYGLGHSLQEHDSYPPDTTCLPTQKATSWDDRNRPIL
ncbi:MAG: hypothetical protein EWM72_01011 [Nitrospira sp.]|nr:MAG: hypothetical protein EWM72_01011 [Nitrospira sp.]